MLVPANAVILVLWYGSICGNDWRGMGSVTALRMSSLEIFWCWISGNSKFNLFASLMLHFSFFENKSEFMAVSVSPHLKFIFYILFIYLSNFLILSDFLNVSSSTLLHHGYIFSQFYVSLLSYQLTNVAFGDGLECYLQKHHHL